MSKSEDPKTKSAVTPIKTVRNYARGLNREERRLRNLLQKHGDDKDLAGLTFPIRDQYLRLGREAREMAMFDVRIRRELAEARDAEYRVMSDEMIEKMLVGTIRRRGYRRVDEVRNTIRQTLMRQGADKAATETFVDTVCPAVAESDARLTATTQLNHAYDRIETDLDEARADVDEALAHSEVHAMQDPYEDPGPPAEAPSDEAAADHVRSE